jgi:PAS domain S-box-containing protein
MKKCNILVVEDEALIAANLVNTLSSLGYAVHQPVAKGEDAICAVKARKPDLVLMDIQLIGAMDGIEAAEKIRAIADIPIVYLTAYSDDLRLKQAQLTEPYGYIVKPAHSRELHATIQMALYKHGLDRKLKESEERLRSTLASMDDLVFTLDENGIFISSYHPIITTLYVMPEQFIGKSFRDVLPKELVEQIQKAINDVKITGATQRIEYSLYFNGKSSWFSTKISPRYSLKGTFAGVTVVARDITERKTAENALGESEKKFHSMVEASPDIIWEIDTQGIFTYISSQCSTQLGYAQEDLIGKPFVNLIQPESATAIKKLFLAHVEEKDSFKTLEVPAKRCDGSPCIIEIRSVPIIGNDGQTTGFRGIAHDITERKKAEEALLQANKKLNLLSSITRHDINNKMTVLQGYLSILRKKQLDPTLNGYCDKAANAAECISSMIQFTKEYEKIGVNAPVWQEVQTVLDTATKQAPLGQVIVKNDFPSGAEVFADPLIVKVFYNLMDNAARYGGKIKTLRFSAEEAGDDHVIICEDDGDGVVAEEKEKIFERGFGKNTGLGLALAREILDITGITIKETGEPGKGARFEMTVPKGAWRTAGTENSHPIGQGSQ